MAGDVCGIPDLAHFAYSSVPLMVAIQRLIADANPLRC